MTLHVDAGEWAGRPALKGRLDAAVGGTLARGLCARPAADEAPHGYGIKPHTLIILQFYSVDAQHVPLVDPFSWLIRAIGRIRFLAVLRLRPPFLVGCQLGPPTSFQRPPSSAFKAINAQRSPPHIDSPASFSVVETDFVPFLLFLF